MCYLQLSLWHIPAEVIIGNTLSMEFRQKLYTPAHYLGNWSYRLTCQEANNLIVQDQQETIEKKKPELTPEDFKQVIPMDDYTQLSFDF